MPRRPGFRRPFRYDRSRNARFNRLSRELRDDLFLREHIYTAVDQLLIELLLFYPDMDDAGLLGLLRHTLEAAFDEATEHLREICEGVAREHGDEMADRERQRAELRARRYADDDDDDDDDDRQEGEDL